MVESVAALGKEEIQRISGILDFTKENYVAILEFKRKWQLLAIDLCDYYAWKLKWIERLLQNGEITLAGAFKVILENWVEWNKEEATLENLLSILTLNGLNTYAAIVAKTFSIESWSENNPHCRELSPTGINPAPVSGNPVDEALGNSIVVTAIFKLLGFEDRKNFRLVNRLWMTETLTYWRKHSYLVIHGDKADNSKDTLSMMMFLQLYNSESYAANSYSLVNPPFLRYCLSKQFVRPFPNARTAEEDLFWKVCGCKLTHLKLFQCEFYEGSFLKTIHSIVLRVCKNLKEIDIDGSRKNEDRPAKKIEDVTIGSVPICDINKFKVGHDERKYIKKQEMEKLLKMMPKLKVLETRHKTESFCKSLLEPANNGEIIQLEKLITWDSWEWNEDGHQSALRNYIERIPESLKELQTSTIVKENEEYDFHVYAALAQCVNLKVLKLCYNWSWNLDPEYILFYSLASIRFSELTKLRVEISTGKNEYFDFNSLTQLPKLATFMITYDRTPTYLVRREGYQDWINEGDWLRYTPEGLQMEENIEQVPLTKCESLRHFFFDGWMLNLTDLQLFRGWFPKLTFLQAKLCSQTFPVVFDYWRNIKTVSLLGESEIQQGELESARRDRENIHIVRWDNRRCDFAKFEKF